MLNHRYYPNHRTTPTFLAENGMGTGRKAQMEGELPRLSEHYGSRASHATRYHCDHVGIRRVKRGSRLGLWNSASNFVKVPCSHVLPCFITSACLLT